MRAGRSRCKRSSRLNVLGLLTLTLGLTVFDTPCLAQQDPSKNGATAEQLIRSVKRLEKRLGFRRTHNFSRHSNQVAAEYRCYYTGKLELPESYEGLALAQGTSNGCTVDPDKYDVFFYPLEAMASGSVRTRKFTGVLRKNPNCFYRRPRLSIDITPRSAACMRARARAA